MKELTVEIEQKARAYDKALENARHYHREMGDDIKCILEECFSELKESEDERIRKAIIRVLAHQEARRFLSVDVKDCLAWLERQGKQNPFDYENANIKQKDFAPKSAMEAIKEVTVDNANKVEPKDYNSIDPHFCKPADKVEPKFNEGDWCIDNEDGIIFQVVKVLDNTYTYRTNEGEEYACTHYSLENDARLWTIEEAKDGDVLSDGTTIFIFKDLLSDGSVMSYCDYDTDSGESDAFCPLSMNLMCSKITPATKEQRDTLFKAMADARYTFDFEKKELKKIEQPKLTEFEDAVKDMMDDYRDAIGDNDATTEEVKKHAAYLLSLIPHKLAKWSEEDKGILLSVKCVIDNVWHSTSDIDTGGYSKEELEEMWNWLNEIWERVEYPVHKEKLDKKDEDTQQKVDASIEAAIKAHAETYSFNIESTLFPQLTKEQQKLWKNEIEQACVSGGNAGVSLAMDLRYKENIHDLKANIKGE